MRGSGNYDTRFFLDGVDIPLLFHYGGVKSTYNSLALASVDLYPGGFGTRYGGCVGGVVELKGRPARSDRWHTRPRRQPARRQLPHRGTAGRAASALLLTGRRSFVGEIWHAALEGQEDVELPIAPYYWDAVARLDWDRRRTIASS